MDLTDADRKILRELQAEGRLTNVELAARTNMSESPCLRRTRALEDAGIIKGYRAVVDPARVGLPIYAYILVNLDQRSETDTRRFFDAVAKEPRVIECAAITGASDLILRVVARDIEDLADLTMHGILRLPTVKDIASCIVLKTIKADAGVPV
jgi:Lrp/AsnC family leucine-responsive transcriptional regulator